MTRPATVLLLALGFATLTSTPARSADDPLTFRGSLSWINAASNSTPTESAVNPDNQVLQIPDAALVSEFRPNLKIGNGQIQFIVRPRVRYEATRVQTGRGEDQKTHDPTSTTESQINEAYGQWTVSDSVTFAYGRQSYQWGAAESLSPSNRMFHDTAAQRGILYEVRGKNIARLNLSAGKWFSTVLMTEYEENEDEGPFRAEEEFQSTGLMKSEVSWNDGVDYFGIVVGGRQHGRGWIGEYFSLNVPFLDGLSIYGDASQQRGSDAWYPTEDGVVTFAQTRVEEKKVESLAVGGLKYDFVNGAIIRAEYIYNQSGYDKDERELALKAFEAENPAQLALLEQNTSRFLTPGLELPGQRFAYASLHFPDFFWITDLTFFTRGTRSLTDGSTAGYVSLEYKIGDHGTLSASATGARGEKDQELRGYSNPTQTIAYRHDW
jgi:hypothetical protein